MLVLGNSDTAGLFSDARTWNQIVRDGLAARVGNLDWQEMTFLVIARSAPGRVEARVREFEPDLVLMPVGTYLWTVGFRRLTGDRIGGFYKRLEDRFDAATRRRGAMRDRANRIVRFVARRTLGASPLATQAQTTDAIRRVLDTVARLEQTQVAVISYPPESPRFLGGKLHDQRLEFMADVERAALDHHFAWLSGDDALTAAGITEPVTTPDGFHFNALGHRVHGEYVLRRLLLQLEMPVQLA